MKRMLAILTTFTLTLALSSEARIVRSWSYQELYEQADVVAIVEVTSVSKSKELMPGNSNAERFEGKVAQLAVGLVLKGEADLKTINLLHFAYAKTLAVYNGADFIDFSDSKEHQYLVFLKKDKTGKLVPVTGRADAAQSVKKIVSDHPTPIDPKK